MDAEQRRLELVGSLRNYLTRPGGADEVTHSMDTPVLEDPPLIEGEQPDLLARGLSNKLIIGLVKTGPEVANKQSLHQYKAFGSHLDPETGEGATLNLAVPKNLKAEAREALEAAGLTSTQFHLIGVDRPN